MPIDFLERSEIIEECYEFMLAYAAQGLPDEQGSQAGGQVRAFLGRSVEALTGLSESCVAAVRQAGLEPPAKYLAFITVLDRDANDSSAALGLVLAQPSISSQLGYNLNASSHLRALLMDLFLLGEILRKRRSERTSAGAGLTAGVSR
jgi:hypothetical protein